MKLSVFFVSALSALVVVEGATIPYDTVQPFPQPEPVTISEKAAAKYTPSMLIREGCHPCPAVNAAGEISGGLDGSAPDKDCSKAPLGSQVYSRSLWYQDNWAIMYAWYFPKDSDNSTTGVRHDWISAFVWLDNPASQNQTIIGFSVYAGGERYKGIVRRAYPPEYLNGTSPKMIYYEDDQSIGFHSIEMTSLGGGEFQDLIHWSQLTDEARAALETADFGSSPPVPFNDANWEKSLEWGWEEVDQLTEHFDYWFDGKTQ